MAWATEGFEIGEGSVSGWRVGGLGELAVGAPALRWIGGDIFNIFLWWVSGTWKLHGSRDVATVAT